MENVKKPILVTTWCNGHFKMTDYKLKTLIDMDAIL